MGESTTIIAFDQGSVSDGGRVTAGSSNSGDASAQF